MVGLITTDGCLSKDKRHVEITAKDKSYVASLKERLGLKAGVGRKADGKGKYAHRIQIANVTFYNFLTAIGLIPAKSLKLKALKVPYTFFRDFLRGVIDGDGSIRRWKHNINQHEQWNLTIYSASSAFVEWLFSMTKKVLKINGRIHRCKKIKSTHRQLYIIKYGKVAAKVILKECYYPFALSLERKNRLAKECLSSYKGWETSKTVFQKR